ncbi:hypothetical protein GCM10022243_00320 [Saccharothrix violaceirubra]|nr:tetratricopeptide repeat protein [Saccharothrix violaceirubra]
MARGGMIGLLTRRVAQSRRGGTRDSWYTRGHGDGWFEHLQETLARARHATRFEAEVSILKVLAIAHLWHGRTRESIETFGRVLDLYRDHEDWDGVGATLNNLGAAHAELGQDTEARALYQQAVDLHDTRHPRPQHAGILANMALVVARQGDLDTARSLCERALAMVADHPPPATGPVASTAYGHLGIVHRLAGRVDLAVEALGTSLLLARQAGDRLTECFFLNEMGETLRVGGDLPEAVVNFRRAPDLATTMNHSPQASRAHAGITDCGPAHLSHGTPPPRTTHGPASA